MPSHQDSIRFACVYVRVFAEGVEKSRGTGYLVGPRTVATCAHVIADLKVGTILSGMIQVQFREIDLNSSRNYWFDVEIPVDGLALDTDCALLEILNKDEVSRQRLDEVQKLALPLPLSQRPVHENIQGTCWMSFGYPKSTGGAGIWVFGLVESPTSSNNKMHVFSEKVKSEKIGGFSGSPVIVDGQVVGHVEEVYENTSGGVSFGTLFVRPVEHIRSLQPGLLNPEMIRSSPRPAIEGYDRDWYINRESEEKSIQDHLSEPGRPVVLWGPERFGKTTLLSYIEECLRSKDPTSRFVRIDLRAYTNTSYDDCLLEIAKELEFSLYQTSRKARKIWKRPGAPGPKLTEFMRSELLRPDSLLILGIDSADSLWDWPHRGDFFGLVRSWAEKSSNSPWASLRVLIAVASIRAELTATSNQAPFNIANQVALGDLNQAQIKTLARKYGVNPSESALARIRELIGGHPYLVRLVLGKAVENNARLDEIIQSKQIENVVHGYLQFIATWLTKDLLHALLCVIREPDHVPSSDLRRRLIAAGLLVRNEDGQGYRPRFGILRQLG